MALFILANQNPEAYACAFVALVAKLLEADHLRFKSTSITWYQDLGG
jgi:hypothetical protein